MTTDDLCIQRRTSFFSINIQTPQYRENEAQSSNFNRLDKNFIYVFFLKMITIHRKEKNL